MLTLIYTYEIDSEIIRFPFPKTDKVFVYSKGDNFDEVVEGQEILCPEFELSQDQVDSVVEKLADLLNHNITSRIIKIKNKNKIAILGYTYGFK